MIEFLRKYIHRCIDNKDQRQPKKVKYEIENIFILVLIGYLCSYTNILSISHFIERNQKIFQKYELLNENFPSKTTIYRLLDIINWKDIKSLGKDLYNEMLDDFKNEMSNKNRISKILDGKFIISSKRGRTRGYNVVTLFDPNGQISLDQYCVNTHDSEKNALPILTEKLHPGEIISGDAIYCGYPIMNLLTKKKINFVFTLKKNNKNLYKTTKQLMKDKKFLTEYEHYEKQTFTEVKNGQVIKHIFEKMEYAPTFNEVLIQDGKRIPIRTCVKRTIEKYNKRTKKTTKRVTFFVSNMIDMNKIVQTINEHWLIESYHWCLDMVLNEDNCSVTNKNVAMVLNIIRKLVLLIIQLPDFQFKGISKADRLKVNFENIDVCIQKLI